MTLKYSDTDHPMEQARRRWSTTAGADSLHERIAIERSWLPEPDTVTLDVNYRFEQQPWGIASAVEVDGELLSLDAPVELLPVVIPKPWGREIWYTGIEARGECRVRTADGALPLSSYLALAPSHLVRRAPLVLLKILDPRPDPVLGDLYFEVHGEKQEVYVVTHIDPGAWPNGRGQIRFGMNQALRAQYPDDATFRRDYLAAVETYAAIRRRIDGGAAVPTEIEHAAREAMERFTALRPLAVGDVVVVPTWLPHSLQHGVRVIEFQTPTYERYILSFAQRVLTQDHWDTVAAVPRMNLDAAPEPAFVSPAPGVEQIVAFETFRVWRVTLGPGAAFDLPRHPAYALCMVVKGHLAIGALALGPEQAVLIPGATLADPLRRAALAAVCNPGTEAAIFLLAAPDL